MRPWKALSKTTTAGRPVATRAILTAFSTASAPVFSRIDFWSVAAAGRELGEAAADLDVRLVHPDHEALVQVLVDLRVDRLDDGGQRVAEVGAAEAAGEVDVLAPFGVPDAGALGARDDERRAWRRRGRRSARGLPGRARSSFVPAATRCTRLYTPYSAEQMVCRACQGPEVRADTMRPARRLGRVVRQRPAKPRTAVRIR